MQFLVFLSSSVWVSSQVFPPFRFTDLIGLTTWGVLSYTHLLIIPIGYLLFSIRRGYSLIGKSVGLNVATVRSKLDLTVVGSNQGAGELYLRCALGKGTLLKTSSLYPGVQMGTSSAGK